MPFSAIFILPGTTVQENERRSLNIRQPKHAGQLKFSVWTRIMPTVLIPLFVLLTCPVFAFQHTGPVIHVRPSGNDQYNGSEKYPIRTIAKAVTIAKPGTRILVHTGTYREAITIPFGGTSNRSRITIQAAKGEKVLVKGSERIRSWKSLSNGVWEVTLPETFFGTLNPFNTFVDPDSTGLHLGGVFLEGEPLNEVMSEPEVFKKAGAWLTRSENGRTFIKVNFGMKTLDNRLIEISARPFAFQAMNNKVNYVSIQGIQISQVASRMASLTGEQPGAVYTNGSAYWKIENCILKDCRSVAISIGQTGHSYPEASPSRPEFNDLSQNIDSVGHHLIRNNRIYRCGQAGIFGLLHGTCSVIDHNLIEDININNDHPGETAGIYLAVMIDGQVRSNLIRNVKGNKGGVGIFAGPLIQGGRITRNVILNTQRSCLFLFNGHGPVLIDNNIFMGTEMARDEGVSMISSEANVFVQNLFYDCGFINKRVPGRSFATSNYVAHTLVIKQTIPALPIDHRWYSNMFIKKGLDQLIPYTNNLSDHNTFLNGAKASSWADQHSVTDQKDPYLILSERNGDLILKMDISGLKKIKIPVISPELMGFFALSKQYMESHSGIPITVDRDLLGRRLTGDIKVPGPFYRPVSEGSKEFYLFRK